MLPCVARMHACSLRYFDISSASDMDVINANVQLNSGSVCASWRWTKIACTSVSHVACGRPRAPQFSFRLKRYCKTTGLSETASFNGISFPGSQIGSTTYFSLTPSYDASAMTLVHPFRLPSPTPGPTHPATSVPDQIRMLGGVVVAAGRSRRQVSTTATCDPNASCTGGACVCNAGYVGDGNTCTGTTCCRPLSAISGF